MRFRHVIKLNCRNLSGYCISEVDVYGLLDKHDNYTCQNKSLNSNFPVTYFFMSELNKLALKKFPEPYIYLCLPTKFSEV